MCMNSEAVEALHQITAELKAEHEAKDAWLKDSEEIDITTLSNTDNPAYRPLLVTRAEAERIFADRIAAHEGKLRELGWERKIRVEAQPVVMSPTIPHTQT